MFLPVSTIINLRLTHESSEAWRTLTHKTIGQRNTRSTVSAWGGCTWRKGYLAFARAWTWKATARSWGTSHGPISMACWKKNLIFYTDDKILVGGFFSRVIKKYANQQFQDKISVLYAITLIECKRKTRDLAILQRWKKVISMLL